MKNQEMTAKTVHFSDVPVGATVSFEDPRVPYLLGVVVGVVPGAQVLKVTPTGVAHEHADPDEARACPLEAAHFVPPTHWVRVERRAPCKR